MVDLVNINSFDFYRDLCESCKPSLLECHVCLAYFEPSDFATHTKDCEFLESIAFMTVCDDCGRCYQADIEHNCLSVIEERIHTPVETKEKTYETCANCHRKYESEAIDGHFKECCKLKDLIEDVYHKNKNLYRVAPTGWNLINCEEYSSNLSLQILNKQSREYLEVSDYFRNSEKYEIHKIYLIQNKSKLIDYEELKEGFPSVETKRMFNNNKLKSVKKSLDQVFEVEGSDQFPFVFRTNLKDLSHNVMTYNTNYLVYCEVMLFNIVDKKYESVNQVTKDAQGIVFAKNNGEVEKYKMRSEKFFYPLCLVEYCLKQ